MDGHDQTVEKKDRGVEALHPSGGGLLANGKSWSRKHFNHCLRGFRKKLRINSSHFQKQAQSWTQPARPTGRSLWNCVVAGLVEAFVGRSLTAMIEQKRGGGQANLPP